MGSLVLLKKFTIFFLLISVSLFSASFAGGRTKFVSKLGADVDVEEEEVRKEEESMVHERVLRTNTRDYGRYDPSPSLSKPPSKLIPN